VPQFPEEVSANLQLRQAMQSVRLVTFRFWSIEVSDSV